MSESRFIKISATGEQLPRDAAEWEAVLDTRSGLMWSLQTKKVSSWSKAEAAAKKINAAGFADWRLPTVDELFPLADRTKFSPALDGEFFPKCPSDWFWTSTVAASSPSVCAWFVFFLNGYANYGSQSSAGFVRAVRASQS